MSETALKTKIVQIPLEGRDKGKVFQLVEMPALKAEKWAARAWLMLSRTSVNLPPEMAAVVENAGWAGLAFVSFQALAGAKWEDVEPLMDEMMDCVKAVRDARHPEMVFPLIDTDIMEVETRFWLRKQIIDLHTDFFSKGVLSKVWASAPTDRQA